MVCDKIIYKDWAEPVFAEDVIKKLYNDLYLSFGLTQNQIYNGSNTYKFTNNQNNEKENNKMGSSKYLINEGQYGTIGIDWSNYWDKVISSIREPKKVVLPIPRNIYYNDEKQITTVIWEDGTSTMVKCTNSENFADDNGFVFALAKKLYGTRTAYMKFVKNGKHLVKKVKKDNKKNTVTKTS